MTYNRSASLFFRRFHTTAVLVGAAIAVASCASDDAGSDGAAATSGDPTATTGPQGTPTVSATMPTGPMPTSTTSASAPGPTGTTGPTGATGPTGPTGATGPGPTGMGGSGASGGIGGSGMSGSAGMSGGVAGSGVGGSGAAGSGMGGAGTAGSGMGGAGTAGGGMGGAGTAGAGTAGTGMGGGGSAEDFVPSEEHFGCIADWDQVLGFRITNVLGQTEEAIAVAENPEGGIYPTGTILQHLPTEAMVKRAPGFSPETKDWEFFLLTLNDDGTTTIAERGTTEIQTAQGETCASCHSMATDEYDFVCNTWAEHGGAGNCGFDFMDSFLEMQLATDTRCQ